MPDFDRLKDELPDPRLMKLALSLGVAGGSGGATIEKYQSTGFDEWQIAIGGLITAVSVGVAVRNWCDIVRDIQ